MCTGFLGLLKQLTVVGDVGEADFAAQFARMRAASNYYIVVLHDTVSDRIVGTGTLLVELKFIHTLATVCTWGKRGSNCAHGWCLTAWTH
jgi:glucosamine-phosphate N-acetyltransferase